MASPEKGLFSIKVVHDRMVGGDAVSIKHWSDGMSFNLRLSREEAEKFATKLTKALRHSDITDEAA